MKKLEHNVETGEVKEVDMTSDEIAQSEALGVEIQNDFAARQLAKRAVLEKLGLTAEELAAALS